MSGTQQVDEGAGGAPDNAAEVEARALRMGWQPREKYRGPADKWVPAEEFIERGERMMPLLLERNRSLDRTVANLERQLAEQGGTLASLVKSTRRAEEVGYKRAMRELQERRAKAVADGDTTEFNKVEQEIADLGEPPPKETAPAAPGTGGAPGGAPGGNGGAQLDPVVAAWMRQNTWFQRDPIANAAAIAALSVVEREFPGQSLEENLAEVTERMRTRFPEHFGGAQRRRAAEQETGDGEGAGEVEPPAGNRRRQAPPMVAGSSSAPARRPGPRSFEALPAEAKREYERQVKMLEGKGEPFTKDEYARYYWEAEGEAA